MFCVCVCACVSVCVSVCLSFLAEYGAPVGWFFRTGWRCVGAWGSAFFADPYRPVSSLRPSPFFPFFFLFSLCVSRVCARVGVRVLVCVCVCVCACVCLSCVAACTLAGVHAFVWVSPPPSPSLLAPSPSSRSALPSPLLFCPSPPLPLSPSLRSLLPFSLASVALGLGCCFPCLCPVCALLCRAVYFSLRVRRFAFFFFDKSFHTFFFPLGE